MGCVGNYYLWPSHSLCVYIQYTVLEINDILPTLHSRTVVKYGTLHIKFMAYACIQPTHTQKSIRLNINVDT